MSHPRRIYLLATAAAVTALGTLAGCAREQVEFVEIEPRSCVAGEWNNGPDRSTVVECTEPHSFDIIAPLGEWPELEPATISEGMTAREAYDRILAPDADDDLASGWRDWAYPRCWSAFLDLLGLDAIEVGHRGGDELGLHVEASMHYAVVASLAKRDEFEVGDRTTLCSVVWLDDDGTTGEIAYPEGGSIASLTGPGLPPELRECFTLADGVRAATPCDEPHTGQVLVDLDAGEALGRSWVEDVDPATGRTDDYSSADKMCEAVIEQLLGDGRLGGEVEAWADIRPTDGWTSFDGSYVEDARYPVSCAVIIAQPGATLDRDLWG